MKSINIVLVAITSLLLTIGHVQLLHATSDDVSRRNDWVLLPKTKGRLPLLGIFKDSTSETFSEGDQGIVLTVSSGFSGEMTLSVMEALEPAKISLFFNKMNQAHDAFAKYSSDVPIEEMEAKGFPFFVNNKKCLLIQGIKTKNTEEFGITLPSDQEMNVTYAVCRNNRHISVIVYAGNDNVYDKGKNTFVEVIQGIEFGEETVPKGKTTSALYSLYKKLEEGIAQ